MCGLVAFCGLAGAGEVWYVDDDAPADFSTIQAALDAASDGDTIIVRDGYYTGEGNRDMDFKGKAVHLKSENGPENCIIDAQGSEGEPHRGFVFRNGEGPNTILDGFTITGGYAGQPGGGGILCLTSSPLLSRLVISNCRAPGLSGLRYGGGALCVQYGEPLVTHSRLIGNGARYGGGVLCFSGQLDISNCIIAGNGSNSGGAVFNRLGNTIIQNCTIVGNTGSGCQGGAVFSNEAHTEIDSSIIWQNAAPNCKEPSLGPVQITVASSSFVSVSYCLIENGEDSVYAAGGTLTWSEGNIDADPLFAAPDKGDYHLRSESGRWNPEQDAWVLDDVTSPCLNAGDPDIEYRNEPMPHGGRVNMGAYGNTAQASKAYVPALSVQSHPLSSLSITGDHSGNTPYAVWCEEGELVELALDEPLSIVSDDQLYKFAHWVIDGVPKPHEATTVTVLMDGDHTATAVYNLLADTNGDCVVNVLDLIFVRNRLGERPYTGDNWRADITCDMVINVLDLIAVRNYLGTRCSE